MDLDSRQTRLCQCCQELFATEWCELVLFLYSMRMTLVTTCNGVGLMFLLLSHPQIEYKYDKEMMKGCVIPVVDDKLTLLAMKNAEMASEVSLSPSLLATLWLYYRILQNTTCCKSTNTLFLLKLYPFLPSRWSTERSMKSQRATTCLSWTLLKSSIPRQCAVWCQR